MSQLENSIAAQLDSLNIRYLRQYPIPVKDWPWKTPKSRNPRCDFYLPDIDLYVEVKGFMTMEAISKLYWFCTQPIRYYIFQGTELDWEHPRKTACKSKAEQQRQAIKEQVKEVETLSLKSDPTSISLLRLDAYLAAKEEERAEWLRGASSLCSPPSAQGTGRKFSA
tara:strand:+ start:640 stop:1140 length:501 start_codon:yes stop_codon:yes gene_type:complete